MAIARVIIVLAMIAAMGIGSVAIGFAVRRIFENLLAGIIILLRHERRFGDFIRCQGTKAGWGNILLRETHIPLTDDQLVIVPNSMLWARTRVQSDRL